MSERINLARSKKTRLQRRYRRTFRRSGYAAMPASIALALSFRSVVLPSMSSRRGFAPGVNATPPSCTCSTGSRNKMPAASRADRTARALAAVISSCYWVRQGRSARFFNRNRKGRFGIWLDTRLGDGAQTFCHFAPHWRSRSRRRVPCAAAA